MKKKLIQVCFSVSHKTNCLNNCTIICLANKENGGWTNIQNSGRTSKENRKQMDKENGGRANKENGGRTDKENGGRTDKENGRMDKENANVVNEAIGYRDGGRDGSVAMNGTSRKIG